jgi:hypothetical protein
MRNLVKNDEWNYRKTETHENGLFMNWKDSEARKEQHHHTQRGFTIKMIEHEAALKTRSKIPIFNLGGPERPSCDRESHWQSMLFTLVCLT